MATKSLPKMVDLSTASPPPISNAYHLGTSHRLLDWGNDQDSARTALNEWGPMRSNLEMTFPDNLKGEQHFDINLLNSREPALTTAQSGRGSKLSIDSANQHLRMLFGGGRCSSWISDLDWAVGLDWDPNRPSQPQLIWTWKAGSSLCLSPVHTSMCVGDAAPPRSTRQARIDPSTDHCNWDFGKWLKGKFSSWNLKATMSQVRKHLGKWLGKASPHHLLVRLVLSNIAGGRRRRKCMEGEQVPPSETTIQRHLGEEVGFALIAKTTLSLRRPIGPQVSLMRTLRNNSEQT